jgi:hypothetical protein
VRHQDAVDVQQNLDEQNLDVVLPYFHHVVLLDVVVHLFLQMNYQRDVVVVDHPMFQMDYFPDDLKLDALAVDEVRLVYQKDYYPDVARQVLLEIGSLVADVEVSD